MAILTALGRLPNVRLRDEVADSNLFDVGRTRALGRLVVTWAPQRLHRPLPAVEQGGGLDRRGQRLARMFANLVAHGMTLGDLV